MAKNKVLFEVGNLRIVDVDPMNVKLETFGTVQRGDKIEVKWIDRGYFHTINRALEVAIDKEYGLDKSTLDGASTYLKRLESLRDEIIRAIRRD